jgi:hypothetical protein
VIASGEEDSPTALLLIAMVEEAPFRTMMMAAYGAVSREMLEALLIMLNGSFSKALAR